MFGRNDLLVKCCLEPGGLHRDSGSELSMAGAQARVYAEACAEKPKEYSDYEVSKCAFGAWASTVCFLTLVCLCCLAGVEH